ncbi:MAG: hypothetical protein ACTHK5_11535 [Tsuneonella sp.]
MKALITPFVAAAAILAAAANPAWAGTTKETPGTPCTPGGGVATNNPCKGNNGNPSPQGNVNKTPTYPAPDPFTIGRPGNDRGAFITQIGDVNTAAIKQSSSAQYARIDQTGNANGAAVTQQGTGDHYATVDQTGGTNAVDLLQSGDTTMVARLTQTGNDNVMRFSQSGSALSSGVEAIQQNGDRNLMTLTQAGENNQARLTQDGSDNTMNPVQIGDNNRLIWTQTGNGLSDLGISQSGGSAIQVTQTK